MLSLFRALIPSWRFFDDVGPSVRLLYKTDSSTWGSFFPTTAERHWYQLFINAEGNLRLAIQSLAERLASEIGDIKEGHEQDIASSVTYLLIAHAIRAQIVARQMKSRNFQFKLLVDDETLLISDLHEVG